MKLNGFAQVAIAAAVAFAGMVAVADFKNGTTFKLGNVPGELVVEQLKGEPVHFLLEENITTGFSWEVESNTNECTVVLKHRGSDKGMICGAPGVLDVTVTSRMPTPVQVKFRYRRPWEKDTPPWKTMRLVLRTAGAAKAR